MVRRAEQCTIVEKFYVRDSGARPSPAFPMYASDWLAGGSVQSMTPAEEGAFIHLLCIAWNDSDCSLPNDPQELSLLSRLGRKWFQKPNRKATMTSGERILRSFVVRDGRLYNERLLRERDKQIEHRQTMASAGKYGASRRWGNHNQAIAKPSNRGDDAIPGPMASDGSSTSTSKGPPLPPFDFEGRFTDLWNTFPKRGRIKRPEAERQYLEKLEPATDRAALHDEIVAAVTGKWATSKQWADGYIPGLGEFLRLERWREEPEQANGTGSSDYPVYGGLQ